ncbi:hypothetical protein K438DRAFT_1972639 [Mycena galopus ATCC 62051]|nr:hypothetical protein K438DRAFT_1972639 [Mycena galopus ATCC 62051]
MSPQATKSLFDPKLTPLSALLAEHLRSLYACTDPLRDARRTDGAHGVLAGSAHTQVRSLLVGVIVHPNAFGASPAKSALFPRYARSRAQRRISRVYEQRCIKLGGGWEAAPHKMVPSTDGVTSNIA